MRLSEALGHIARIEPVSHKSALAREIALARKLSKEERDLLISYRGNPDPEISRKLVDCVFAGIDAARSRLGGKHGKEVVIFDRIRIPLPQVIFP